MSYVARIAKAEGKPCSVCGEMAGEHMNALLLMGMGYDGLSVAPNFISEVKYAIRRTPRQSSEEIFREVAAERSGDGVRRVLKDASERLMEITAAESIRKESTPGQEPGGEPGQIEEGGAL